MRLMDSEQGALSHLLRQPAKFLQSMTLEHAFPSLGQQDICFTGAAQDMETGEDTPDGRLRIGWCPQCLLGDRAGDGDHYLRWAWAVAAITICPRHRRPLIERCQNCYRFVQDAEFARYGTQMALICPHCQTPLDAAQGLDFVNNNHVLDWQKDKLLPTIWKRLIRYEGACLKVLT